MKSIIAPDKEEMAMAEAAAKMEEAVKEEEAA
jgi:hypothetical protein